jgi:hypothetical protein
MLGVDELPSVLWSLRTTPNAATQETPFFLVHSVEAVLPVKINHEAPRILTYNKTTSKEALQDDVDALDEARDVAFTRSTQYQQICIIIIVIKFDLNLLWLVILYFN